MKKRRVLDESFKKMAVELSEAKGSVTAAAAELGLDVDMIRLRYSIFTRQQYAKEKCPSSDLTGLKYLNTLLTQELSAENS
jgi:hypothetical protein